MSHLCTDFQNVLYSSILVVGTSLDFTVLNFRGQQTAIAHYGEIPIELLFPQRFKAGPNEW